jgi:hydroxyacylglutathione hydrolase
VTIEQIRAGSDNFSYLIISEPDKTAALVDPSLDASAALARIKERSLILDYIFLTHYHTDHTAALAHVKRLHPHAKVAASEQDDKFITPHATLIVKDGTRLHVGAIPLTIIATPGHTPGGICILVDDEALITGDTLFIGNCGRTDLTGGSLKTMFETLHNKIMPLPNHLIIYPGHDYGTKPSDTLGNQKKTNKTLRAKTLQEFARIP